MPLIDLELLSVPKRIKLSTVGPDSPLSRRLSKTVEDLPAQVQNEDFSDCIDCIAIDVGSFVSDF